MPTILIVDDDEVDRELARRALEDVEGLDLRFAERGEQALERIGQSLPDLVLTDLRMPGMDGLQLVQRLRERHPLVPVVLMTSQGNERIAVRALEAGAASYVPKDDLTRDLADTVRRVLEVAAGRRSQRAVLAYLDRNETHFELTNDPALIAPLVGYLQGSLERIGFGDETLRTQVGMSLMEAVSNAMVHGNLQVSSDLRRDSLGDYYSLIEQRRGQTPYADRRVRCSAVETAARIEYVIADEGPGFDPARLPDPAAPENTVKVSGRGLMLIRMFMDDVRFNATGNRITMAKTAP